MNVNSGLVERLAQRRGESAFTTQELLLCIGTGLVAVIGVIVVIILHRRLSAKTLAAKRESEQNKNLSQNEIEHLLHQVGNAPASVKVKDEPESPRGRGLFDRLRAVNVGVSLVLLGTLFALSVYFVTRGAPAKTAVPEPVSAKCYLLSNHQVSGPYPLVVIMNLNSNGLLRSETLYRAEDSTEWNKLPSLLSIAK